MPEPRPVATRLEGRSSEQERIEVLLARAAGGEAQTILVVGSAGVGKTALVEATVTEQRDAIVAEGNCLPLVSVTIPFMAIRGAIASVPAGRGEAATIVTGDESSTPGRFDGWLDTLCADHPAVLVIEDLHWADQHTLDTLMYVISGPAARRLAVVGTLRDDELGDGHPLQRWLADVRRMPRVTELTLGPLDRVATGDQLAALLGESPHQALVEDVQRRSGGNPLLTRLLVDGLSRDAMRAADTIPSNLRSAVLQSWFRLPERTREVVTTLAVGSGPMSAGELAAVVGEDEDCVRHHLTVGVAGGTLEPRRGGTFWFRHPLNAEILEEAVPLDVRARWHAAFADLLERRVHDGSSARIAAIAEHRLRAGDAASAYRWAVRAAIEHEAVGAHLEAIRMLRRALELHEQRGEAPESVRDLLDRLQTAAGNAGADDDELEAVEAILGLASPPAEPLTVAGLLVRRMHLRFSTGKSFLRQEDALEAVRLSAVAPTSPEHALALAELAHAAIWHGDPDGRGHAAHALAAARAAGDDRALAFALAANAMAAVNDNDGVAGRRFAEEAVNAGLRAREWWGCAHAVLWEANALDTWACESWADSVRTRRGQLTAAGAPHAYLAWIAASEAGAWMSIGDWRQCQARLRDTLAAYPGPLADASVRLIAARLATWQGRQAEAEQHLARADELVNDRSGFLPLEFDAVRAEVKLGAGDSEGAFQACLTGLALTGSPPTMCEWLVPLAARALADQVQSARDAGLSVANALSRVDEFEAAQPVVVRDIGPPTPYYDRQLEGLAALYAAELGRARGAADERERWVVAAECLGSAHLLWEEAYACRRAAEALLCGAPDRPRGAVMLRRGLQLAEQLAAQPLVTELAGLAMRARIATRVAVAAPPGAAAARHHVTPREREILALVVSGRTYGEIARDLVISEKTVSSHISNLLTKTGMSNRVELAGYAERAGLVASQRS